MKNNYPARLRGLLSAIFSLCFLSAVAQLEQGKVYRFDNVSYSGYSMNANSRSGVTATPTNESHKSQLWYVSDVQGTGTDATYRLRSVSNGDYLKGCGQSTPWTFTSEEETAQSYLYLRSMTAGDNTYYTLSLSASDSGRDKMHCDGGKTIVGWSFADNAGTQWRIVEVTEVDGAAIDAAWLESNWAKISEALPTETQITSYQAALDAIFADKACTRLNSTYAAMTQETLTADTRYTGLPATLRAMVLKIWKTQTTAAGATRQSVETAWAEPHYSGQADLAWSGEYAQRYRVQLYEPYTQRECTNAALKINIHTNLNNPTGIFGNEQEVMYIMVEGEIKEHASLYLGAYTGHGQAGGYNEGVELHTGLNVVPFWSDKQWTCIYYTVPTLKEWDGTTNKQEYAITDFPDLKIHIEGGNVNGYYNEMGDELYAHGRTGQNVTPTGDNEEDWDYLAARNVMDDLTIVGKNIVFQFYFNPTADNDGNLQNGTDYYFTKGADGSRQVRVPDFLEPWNRIVMAQWLTLGLLSREDIAAANATYPAPDGSGRGIYAYTGNDAEYGCDYSDHYRMHCLAIGLTSGYMSGGWTSCNYNCNTFESIIKGIVTEAGPAWGPAHEIGHQHQGPINTAGLTEVTNNLFANICVWYMGMATSRVNGGEGDLTSVLQAYNQEGSDFFTNNIWAQTHMYYKLWLYYHLTGKNIKFYPRLFEMLRRDPIIRDYNQMDQQAAGAAPVITGRTPLLHFYKKCCLAAGEDLTEFFRAYGFFTPMDKRLVGDYSSAEYTQTQAQIDAAIAEIKALGLRENKEVLFINDYTAGVTYKSHDGTDRTLWDGRTYSDLGSYTDFNGMTDGGEVTGTYNLIVSDGTAVVSGGEGGTGFFIYDKDGHLLAFSSDKSFPVNDKTALAIAKGEVQIQSVTATGESVSVPYTTEEAALSVVTSLLDDCATLLDNYVDEGTENEAGNVVYTKVGYYKGAAVAELRTQYEQLLAIYQDKNLAQYVPAYEALKATLDAVTADKYARVPLLPGNKYAIKNATSGHYLQVIAAEGEESTASYGLQGADKTLPAKTDAAYNGYLWSFEKSATEGQYYLKNALADGLYIQSVSEKQNGRYTVGTEKYAYRTQNNDSDPRYFNFYHTGKDTYINKHGGNSTIISWTDGSGNSLWTITLVEEDDTEAAKERLRELGEKTQTLLGKVARIDLKGDMDMSAFHITSNTPEDGHGTELLVDGNTNTFFHSNWQGTAVNEPHNLIFDAGEGQELEQFIIRYTTLVNNWNVDAPKAIEVYGSNDNTVFTLLTTLTTDAEGNALPTTKNADFTSGMLGTEGVPYRYIKLAVTDATGGRLGGYYYFGLSELVLSRGSSILRAVNETYSAAVAADGTDPAAVADAAVDALTLVNKADVTSDELNAEYAVLEPLYNRLLAAVDGVDNAVIDAARRELQATIDATRTILGECGTVTDGAADFPLQSTASGESGYLYCNAPYTGNNADKSVQGTDGYHLLDGNAATYLHTDYSGTAYPDDHYIRVYAGENGIDLFSFNYLTRNAGDGQPTAMEVEGSNEADGSYDPIASLSSTADEYPLPKATGKQYQSDILGRQGTKYKYIRFRVTGNSKNEQQGGHYWFCMAEFGMKRHATEVSFNDGYDYLGEQLMLDTKHAIDAAETTCTMSTSVERLEAARAELQARHDRLQTAKEAGDALATLNRYFRNETKLDLSATDNTFPADAIHDTAIGYYTFAKAGAYQEAYAAAAGCLDNAQGMTAAEITAIHDALVTANEALAPTEPKADAYYVLRNCNSGAYCKDALAYAEITAGTNLKWSLSADATDARALWQFARNADGTYSARNLHTGIYLAALKKNGAKIWNADTEPQSVRFDRLGEGQVNIIVNGEKMHAQGANNALVNYNGGQNTASAWMLEEVTDLSAVTHSVSISAYGYAGFYTAYPVSIPQGLKAYYVRNGGVDEPAGENQGKAMLTELTDIIPANTGVILYGAAGTYDLKYSANAGTRPADNMLDGAPYLCYRQGQEEKNYYLFGARNGVVGLYQAYLEYTADGTQTDAGGASTDNTDNGGYFRISPNKIFMAYSPQTAGVAAFHFSFDGTTTAIEGAKASVPADAVVYNLQGQRIRRITASGLYIINGVKRYIRVQSATR